MSAFTLEVQEVRYLDSYEINTNHRGWERNWHNILWQQQIEVWTACWLHWKYSRI